MKLDEYRRMLANATPTTHAKSRRKALVMKPNMADKYTIDPSGTDFVIHFGKHKGSSATDLDDGYLLWLVDEFSKPDKKKFFEDLVDISQHILDTRKAFRAAKAPK